MNDLEVNVELKYGPSFTEYRITGRESTVLAKVESLFRQWPKAGYGTSVWKDGDVTVVWHSNSCD